MGVLAEVLAALAAVHPGAAGQAAAGKQFVDIIMSGGHNRKTIRLKNYDYSQAGMYFATICTKDRECLFGEIKDEEMMLNGLGKIVEKEWYKIPLNYPNVELDEFIVMPNHIHMIIFIMDDNVAQIRAGASPAPMIGKEIRAGASPAPMIGKEIRAGASPAPTLGNIVGAFKSKVFNQWFKYIRQNNLDLIGKIWQRNYYEHIIRNERSLENIRNYICNNPGDWSNDVENDNNKNITKQERKNYYNKISKI
jgi:REP element-mobilizing transposase RayT